MIFDTLGMKHSYEVLTFIADHSPVAFKDICPELQRYSLRRITNALSRDGLVETHFNGKWWWYTVNTKKYKLIKRLAGL